MTEGLRLSKCVAAMYQCSRREAELLIAGGWVMVDGEVIEEPFFRVLDQTITLHPEARAEPVEAVTLLVNKPAGMTTEELEQSITAESHMPDDPAGIRLLRQHFAKLEHPLPLETAACGLAVFTQDWRVLRKLSEDAYRIEHEYVVEVSGVMAPDGLALLKHGLSFQGRALPPIKVSWQNENRLRFAAKAVVPGQIAHMVRSVGLEPVSIKRIRLGSRSMGPLPVGQWRYLPAHERF